MALEKIVKIIFGGDSRGAEDAAKRTGKATEDLGDQFGKLAKSVAAFVVGSALINFFKESVAEAANAERGMARLGVAVTNTGNDFKTLSPALEETVKAVQRMSTATDDDLREALTRMISVSGDVKGSVQNLGVVADLAAFKQINVWATCRSTQLPGTTSVGISTRRPTSARSYSDRVRRSGPSPARGSQKW